VAEQARRDRTAKQIRDPENGKLLARVDHESQKVELHPYRSRPVWVDLKEFVDKKQAE
jgi:hypothetical protein